ncbi:P-type DNA transfer ATPase VirB11 [Sphingomonas sp.]|uniref:P-type DNA transfer ATPase VirB11 n=1 Tax=Sphingomonas sp. TaxID=28214 RepID=UPI003B3B5638
MSTQADDVAEQGVYLRACLAPFAQYLSRSDVTDIYVNQPKEVWLELIGGKIEQHLVPGLDEVTLGRLAKQLAALTHQGISREHPLLSATLPNGSRIQIVAPPATRHHLVLAIRKQVAQRLNLKDYVRIGAFSQTQRRMLGRGDDTAASPENTTGEPDLALDLANAVVARKNILISGGTSTGKTTFLNALLREVPHAERLILIEDTPEVSVEHPNHIGLLAVRGQLGEAYVTANDLVTASLRLRPDRLILGELRGTEAFAFLRAINSGHPGSMTTIHADSPEAAVEQLVLLVLQAGTGLSRQDVRHYVTQTIDLFVQLRRGAQGRYIEHVASRADWR